MVEYRSLLSYDIWIAHLCIDVTYICVFHTHFTSYLTEPNFPFTLFNILETVARVALMLSIGMCVCAFKLCTWTFGADRCWCLQSNNSHALMAYTMPFARIAAGWNTLERILLSFFSKKESVSIFYESFTRLIYDLEKWESEMTNEKTKMKHGWRNQLKHT